MNNFDKILQYAKENIVLLLVMAIFIVTFVIYFKNRDIFVKAKEKLCSFTKHEYNKFCKESEEDLINSTLTFSGESCDEEQNFDKYYSIATKKGSELVARESFYIPGLEMEW